MYRFIDFNDEKTDTLLLLELSDLAKTLSRSSQYETEIRVHSYLSQKEQKVFISHFWNHRPDAVKKQGMKSDIYLRALGNKSFTDYMAINAFRDSIPSFQNPSFAGQLFMLAEDLRLEELCKKERPGTGSDFHVRRKIYTDYFHSQLNVNLQKSFFADALFSLIYLILNSETPLLTIPPFNPDIDRAIPFIRRELENFYDCRSTVDIADVSTNIMKWLDTALNSDMINEYFHLPNPGQCLDDVVSFSDLLRKDPLQNDDMAKDNASGNENVREEEMKTWHRETEEPGKLFLQFELEKGTKTDIGGGTEREGDEGDQAMAVIRGKSKQTEKKDFMGLELTGETQPESVEGKHKYGKSNRHARAICLKAGRPDKELQRKYAKLESEMRFYHKKLKNIIERTMLKKEAEQREQLQMGRLGKNLLSFFTDEHPKIFYKKSAPSKEIDAAFILLVDCSASMFDKMEETKRGIVLFHEALKSVGVPHEVIGFWEDANEADIDNQPNYFFQAIPFFLSLQQQSGPEIMSLKAMEDNRDGFAIRLTAERLAQRTEKQKFLIVFSDGEPAAFDYDDGIIDTHEAVMEARKRGIEVFNIFLSKSGLEFEQKKVFENIYGNRSIIAPYVEELPEVLFPLLKKLLNRSIAN